MSIRRVNPDTGVLEEADLLGQVLEIWNPVIGDNGEVTRIVREKLNL